MFITNKQESQVQIEKFRTPGVLYQILEASGGGQSS